MKLHYLIAAYNEADALVDLVMKLSVVPARFPGSQILIVDNASTDDSKKILNQLMGEHPWLKAYFETEKGMGVAFRRGLIELSQMGLSKDDWIAFNAADLPFGFSDLDGFLKINPRYPDCYLYVGSKSHPESELVRTWKRQMGSLVFHLIRKLFLNMKTRDPQGTLFLRGDQLDVREQILAKDYFFTTELVYLMEKRCPVVEMPVVLKPEIRPSKVNLIRDGWKAIQQVLALKSRT